MNRKSSEFNQETPSESDARVVNRKRVKEREEEQERERERRNNGENY